MLESTGWIAEWLVWTMGCGVGIDMVLVVASEISEGIFGFGFWPWLSFFLVDFFVCDYLISTLRASNSSLLY